MPVGKVIYPPGCKGLDDDVGSDQELVRRLKALAREFQEMGQEDNVKYKGLALYLASEPFMDHASKDVRLLTACCVADVFRIFAPDAPYDDPEKIKDIFIFFVKQLRGLEDIDSASFKRYFYLLENLAWVKSFNICIDLEDSQDVFCSLFKCFFTIVSEKHSAKVKNFMLDIMSPLLTESDFVSQELLDTILITIVEPYKSQNREANSLARDLIRRTANAIEPYIQTFFNNALMLGKTSESEVSDHIFHLIYELNQISPSILLSVLPQLEFKLKSNDDGERKTVTRLLAKMFSDKNSDLAVTNKPLWYCFIGRFNDINLAVRTACVQFCQQFILNQPDLIADITEQLKTRLHDAEESVRLDAVMAIVNAAKKDLSAVTDELLLLIKERTLDKKFKIRREALVGLSQIYKKGALSEEQDMEQCIRIGWIKDKVLHGYYQTSLEDKILIERLFKLNLVPYNYEHENRMQTLYYLYGTLDPYAVKALNEMLRCQNQVLTYVRQILDTMKKEKNTENEKLLAHKIMLLTRMLPEQNRTNEHIKKFFHIIGEDKIVRQNLINLSSIDCGCKKAEESLKEILKKMGNPNPSNVFHTNVKTLVERIAPVMVDVPAMRYLIKMVDDAVNDQGDSHAELKDAGEKGMQLLLMLSTVYPGAFNHEDIYKQLIAFLNQSDEDTSDVAIKIFTNIGARLHRVCPSALGILIPTLQSLAKLGNPKQAKHAVMCLKVVSQNLPKVFDSIFEYAQESLNAEKANLETAITVVGVISEMFPDHYNSYMKVIVPKVFVKEILMKDMDDIQNENTESWCEVNRCSTGTRAKLKALKAMVRWLFGIKSNATGVGTSTMRLLATMIVNDGDLMEHGKIGKADMAHLRLAAACGMIKLAQEPVYFDVIKLEQYQTLALLINDPCYQVRETLSHTLHQGLMVLKLPLEYMAIFSLAASDPVKERRIEVKSFLLKNIAKRREYLKLSPAANAKIFSLLPEYILPYTIHLLAHDPDFKDPNDVDILKSLKECLWFLLEPLMTKNEQYNYNFFRKMLENIKQTKDAQDPNNSEANAKLYAVCDLAMGLIVTKTTSFVLKDFLAEPVLPKKLFTKPNQNINTKFYLPDEFSFSPPKKKQAIELMPGIRTAPSHGRLGINRYKSPLSSQSSTVSPVSSPESMELIKKLASGAAAKARGNSFQSSYKSTVGKSSVVSPLVKRKINVPSKLKQTTLSPLKRSNKDNTPALSKSPKKAGLKLNQGENKNKIGKKLPAMELNNGLQTDSPSIPRGRGRPRKDSNKSPAKRLVSKAKNSPLSKNNSQSTNSITNSNSKVTSPPGKRRRPPKNIKPQNLIDSEQDLNESDSLSGTSPVKKNSPAKRGRPRKKPISDDDDDFSDSDNLSLATHMKKSSPVKRGRPGKLTPKHDSPEESDNSSNETPPIKKPRGQPSGSVNSLVKRRVGRPPKSSQSSSASKSPQKSSISSSQTTSSSGVSSPLKRPRGRPPKRSKIDSKESPKNFSTKTKAVTENGLNSSRSPVSPNKYHSEKSDSPPSLPTSPSKNKLARNLILDLSDIESPASTSSSKSTIASRKRPQMSPAKGLLSKKAKTEPSPDQPTPPQKKRGRPPKSNIRRASIPNGIDSDSQSSSGRSSKRSTPSSSPTKKSLAVKRTAVKHRT